MRIIAGDLRSRIVEMVPGETTRPTQDRIKESIFNRIGPYFDGGLMLDLFGGSGNIGFEGISRGIEKCIFVDLNNEPIKTIKKNAANLKVTEKCRILKMDYMEALKLFAEEQLHFDLIYIDPPYAKQQIDAIMEYLDSNSLVNDDGLIICESSKEDTFKEAYGSLHKHHEKMYGITRVTIYRKEDNNE